MEQVLSRLMLLGIISIYMAKGALPTCMDQFCPAHYQNVALSLIFIFSAAHAAKEKPIELKETKPPQPNRETIQGMLETLEKLTAEFSTMKTSFEELTRQVTSQQFFAEETIRTDGSSGIKQTNNHLVSGLNTNSDIINVKGSFEPLRWFLNTKAPM